MKTEDIKKISAMLKLIPNEISVCVDDLNEIFSQDEKNGL
jgi:septation ring formation regulator EzrA